MARSRVARRSGRLGVLVACALALLAASCGAGSPQTLAGGSVASSTSQSVEGIAVTTTVGLDSVDKFVVPDYLGDVDGIADEIAEIRIPVALPAYAPPVPSDGEVGFIVPAPDTYRIDWENEVGPGYWQVALQVRDAADNPVGDGFVVTDHETGRFYVVDGDPDLCEPQLDIETPGGAWVWEQTFGGRSIVMRTDISPPPGCEGAPIGVDDLMAWLGSLELVHDPGPVPESVMQFHDAMVNVSGLTVSAIDLGERVQGTAVTLVVSGLEPNTPMGAGVCPIDAEPSEIVCTTEVSIARADKQGDVTLSLVAPYELSTLGLTQEFNAGMRETSTLDCTASRRCVIVVVDQGFRPISTIEFESGK